MQVDIRARGFKLTEGLRSHAERRMRFALGATSGRLRNIAMSLSDDNGPRGGLDKRCIIRASLPGAAPVIIEQLDSDLYVAIDRAADRAGRVVARRLGKKNRDRGHTASD